MKYEDLQSVTAEAGVIATLLFPPDYIFTAEQLKPRDFYDIKNGCLYWAIREVVQRGGEQIDAFILSNMLKSNIAVQEKIEQIPIKSIQELFEMGADVARHTPLDYKILVGDILNMSMRRKMYLQAQKMEGICLNLDNKDIDLPAKFFAMTDDVLRETAVIQDIKSVGEKFDDVLAKIAKRKSGEYTSLPFKFPSLNEYVKIEQGELVLFSAYAKTGKSAILLSEAVDICNQGKSVLIIDSELSDDLWFTRLIAHIGQIPFKTLRDGDCTDEQVAAIKRVKEWTQSHKLYHFYMPAFQDADILMLTKRVNALCKLDVIIIDYFKNTSDGNAYDVSNAMGRLVDMVKNRICGEMEIAGIGAVQSDKAGNAALSKNIERNCSTLISLVKKTQEEIATDGVNCGNIKAQVKFNRNGSQHADDEYLDLKFTGEFLNFEEAQQHHDEQPY